MVYSLTGGVKAQYWLSLRGGGKLKSAAGGDGIGIVGGGGVCFPVMVGGRGGVWIVRRVVPHSAQGREEGGRGCPAALGP